jgi:hypothetical protein
MLTALMVVVAAAYMLLRPFLDQLLGREAASAEEKGAGF